MQDRINELSDMRLKRESELKEKEKSLMNWEEKVKQEEAKQMAIFEKQKQAILAKKLAEQNSELILAANKGQLQQMKAEH